MQKKLPFRDYHLSNLLHDYEQQKLPLDLFISNYFRDHKALGSKDRGCIAETTYALIRWQGLLDHLSNTNPTWEKRIELLKHLNWEKVAIDESIPSHVRVSFPKSLYDLIAKSYSNSQADELCMISNHPAPTAVRINSLKVTRDEMIQRWSPLYQISPCLHSPEGIIFHQKINFFNLPEFREGLFEVQDEGSQLIAQLIQAKPGQQVLDYCAGSGGKTLAFAPNMKGKGQIFLHDIRHHALLEAQKRLRRAGIQNAQTVKDDDADKLSKLKKRMDWVLVDAPCSGTGTMRRNPDMKWRFNEEMLQRLLGQQRVIFEKALSFLKPNGHIVYATCSILRDENEKQLEHFIKTYRLKISGEIFQSLPSKGGMDGFFAVALRP